MTPSINKPETCPACGATFVSYHKAIDSWICDECSFVVGSDSARADTGIVNNVLQTEQSEPELIDWASQITVKDKSETNLINALSRVEAVTDQLSLPEDQVIRAGEMIAEAWRTNFMHGRSQEGTIGAVIYAVSRQTNTALPPATIAKAVEADKKVIKRTFRKLNQELDLEIASLVPIDFVTAICSGLNVPAQIDQTTKKILNQNKSKGGNPAGIAAAAVYIACSRADIDVTLHQLAQVVGLTKETIWRHTSNFTTE